MKFENYISSNNEQQKNYSIKNYIFLFLFILLISIYEYKYHGYISFFGTTIIVLISLFFIIISKITKN